jgi:hypothetical protein
MSEVVVVMMLLWGVTAGVTAQAPAAGAKPRISACSVMPRELVAKLEANPQLLKYSKMEEEPIGASGSYCDYGSLGLQINPFASNSKPASPGKEWQPVAGVGDAAFFRSNRGMWAELIVWTGPHHFTIQYSIRQGSTAEATKPTTIELARAIIPKLR